ncbi:MAG: shikimate kinase [Alphaproteobacteria bacterium]|jgi:shikimate kinase|nr:shikimate kinase [Alphaproteobacteria bacterium]MBT5861016.1 shikimate kinase [Alphaproteobacteria bacterium]
MSRKTQSGPRSTVVLIGLMGSGKTSIGRRLAARLGIQFIDADTEIEAAAGSSIHDIFELHGEQAFRDGERRVIARLLDGPVHVLATGGGAFMTDETRARISDSAVSVWLRASLDTLVKRVERSRTRRPLLEAGDPREILSALVDERYPVYGEADIIVETGEGPHEPVVESIVQELRAFWQSSGDDVDGDDDDTQDSSVPSDQETE